jgi:hypothetical protein
LHYPAHADAGGAIPIAGVALTFGGAIKGNLIFARKRAPLTGMSDYLFRYSVGY